MLRCASSARNPMSGKISKDARQSATPSIVGQFSGGDDWTKVQPGWTKVQFDRRKPPLDNERRVQALRRERGGNLAVQDTRSVNTTSAGMLRRTLYALACGIAGLAICTVGATRAEDFPTRPVTLIVPWPAGGTTDAGMRALARSTEQYLRQPIIIENRPGAGGTLAPMQMAATVRPDGYTLAQIPVSVLRVALLRKTTFDPVRDLSFVIGLSGYTFGIAVRAGAPWRTFQDLVADAKAGLRKLSYATAGTATTPHLTMEQIARLSGFAWTHVPFRSTAETVNALMGDHVDAIGDATSWGSEASADQMRVLVTWGARRTANWPHVPTLREVGVNLIANAPYGLAGPKGMAPATMAILHDAFKRGMEETSYLETLRRLDQELLYLNSSDYLASVVRQIAEEEKFIKAMGLTTE